MLEILSSSSPPTYPIEYRGHFHFQQLMLIIQWTMLDPHCDSRNTQIAQQNGHYDPADNREATNKTYFYRKGINLI